MRRILSLVLLLALAFGAQYMAFRTRAGITVTEERLAGVPVLHFHPAAATGRVVLVAHGYAGSKELMRPWGDYLARQGFDVYLYDQPGHGQSSVRLPEWIQNPGSLGDYLKAMIDQLVAEGKARPGQIGLVGHSMGGAAVTAAALADARIQATVAISSAYRYPLPAGRPRNFLILAADRDPIFIQNAVKTQAAQLSSDQAAELIPGRNHITILYDAGVMERVAGWLKTALGVPGAVVPARDQYGWPWVLLALAAGVGSILAVAGMLAPAEPRRSHRSARMGLFTGILTVAVAAFSAVLASVFLRLPWLGVGVLEYLLPYFLVMATVLFVLRLLWPQEFSFPLGGEQEPETTGFLRVVGIFLAFVGVVVPVLHMNVAHALPSTARLLPMGVLALVLWLCQAQEEGLKRAVANELGDVGALLVGLAAKGCIILTWLGATALPNPQLFLPLMVPVAGAVMVLLEFISFVLLRRHYSAASAALLSSLVMAWLLAVTLPLV
jgi:pimeloyl-ACP methyl ester carboxylesterase